MRTDTLLFKLLTVILVSFAVTASVVLFLGKKQLVGVIDQSRRAEFDERLSAIVHLLAQYEARLKNTGREDVYREDFQAMAVKALQAAYYEARKAHANPFVIDQAGNTVMRPEHDPEEIALLRGLPMDRLRKGAAGDVVFKTPEGIDVWCIHRHFEPWGWTAFYLMTVAEKHAAATAYSRMLLVITSLMGTLLCIVLFFLVRRQTQPITDLTRASEAMRLGDYSHPLSRKAEGETLVLANAFESMRQTVRDSIEALRRSEERLQLATGAAGIGIWDWDIVNDVLVWDDDMYRLYGIRREDFGGAYEAWSNCLHPEDKVRTEGEIQAALRGEREYAPEFRIIWPDQTVRHIQAASRTFRDASGKPLRMIGTNIDITELKRAEAVLRESEVFRKRVFESSRVPIIVMDAETYRYIDCNTAAIEIYRFASREATLGRTPLDVSAPMQYDGIPSPERAKYYIERALAEGSVVFEWRHQRPDGEIWDAEVHLMSFRSGERLLLQFTLQDITERKRAEAELRSRQAKLEGIFRSATVGIGETGNRMFTFVNPRLCEITGYREEELLGQASRMLFASDEEFRKATEAIASLYIKGSPGYATYEAKCRRKDGSELDAFVSLASLDKDDPGAGTIFTVMDVTEKKRLETELNQAQKMEAIGALAGGVAHDFNNILSAIMGFASLLQMKLKTDASLQQYADQILLSSERAAALTKTLLSFSRKQKPDLKPVDANAIVSGFQKILARLIREDIEFAMNIFPEALNVKADKGQIEQVLMNLAANARDAMPKGGKFSIATERVVFPSEHGDLPSGAYALISVSDTGIGMDKKTQEHIFEPFFTTKEVGKGTGLGLSIVYSIVKNHGGSIHVYSEPGVGTTFKVTLPLLEAEVVREQAPKGQETLPTGTETILLAEDDAGVRGIAKLLLEECGYTVIEAVDGEEAVSIFREQKDRIHLVLTDLIMPKKNGREAYEEIKKLRPDIKVIFMSGYARDIITQKEILDEGMLFISKPLTLTELLTSVRKALQK